MKKLFGTHIPMEQEGVEPSSTGFLTALTGVDTESCPLRPGVPHRGLAPGLQN